MLLDKKVALITGASRGIGKETAIQFAAAGATVVICAKEVEHLAETAEEIKKITGTEPFALGYDVSDSTNIKEAFSSFYSKHKRLDILVNNAGVLLDSLLGMATPEMVQKTFEINVFSVIFHMQYASRLMTRIKSGSIINISSIIGRFGNEGQVVYGASKAAVIGATLSAAKELAPLNIRANVIAPGFISTDMVKKLPKSKFDDRMESIKMGRIGTPEDVARAALFLGSDLSEYITGQIIGVDGAMVI